MLWIKGMQVLYLFIAALACPAWAQGKPFPIKHPETDKMVVVPAQVHTQAGIAAHEQYFAAPIPKIIHQIWFGDAAIFDSERAQGWQTIAAQYGYAYHLWTENDFEAYGEMFGDATRRYIETFIDERKFDAASDVLRYHLIERFGGMYFDNDVPAPSRDGVFLDPADVWPLMGLILAGETHAREVDNGGMFAQNHIIMAAAHHPVMVALTSSLLLNREAQQDSLRDWKLGANFITGQSLITKTVRGAFTMISDNYLNALNMFCWPEVGPYRECLRDKFSRQAHQPAHIDSIHRPLLP